tara:strand:+ start:268 stop:393 length:126 start_codon:yes stop_codon:yes gene_type:complete
MISRTGTKVVSNEEKKKILPFKHLKKEDFDKMSNKEKREFH